MRINLRSPLLFAFVTIALAGCDLGVFDPIVTGGHTSDSSETGVVVVTSSGDTDSESTGESSFTTASPSTSGDSTSDGPIDSDTCTTCDTGASFVDPPPSGCGVWEQDCPSGQKCTVEGPPPYVYESFTCATIVPDPAQAGESCQILVDGPFGPDTCDLGLTCHHVDADTGLGTCIPLCTGSPLAPGCDPGFACLVSDMPLCLPECDPLLQDCPAGQTCMLSDMDFVCWPVIEEQAGLFESCEYANSCEPGLTCVDADLAAECPPDSLGCCTPYCDLDGPAVCPGVGQSCRSIFEPIDPPPGQEDVGICALPW